MRNPSHALLAVVGTSLAITAASCESQAGLERFDSMVTEDLIRKGCEHNLPFTFSTRHTADKRCYKADFHFPAEHPECNAYVSITVCSAGKLLDPEKYRQWKNEVKQQHEAKTGQMQLSSFLFPNIGKRAVVGMGLGPGAGGDSLVFTTNDGSYDVKVEQGNRLSEAVTGPNVVCQKIAREICRRYDKQQGSL